ncbi:MAG: DoxX family protein [Pseudomonadota bacterium]
MSYFFGLFSLAGRLLLGGFFLKAAYDKITTEGSFQFVAGQIDSLSLALPVETAVLVYLVIALEVIAPLLLMLGVWARLSALALAGFTIAASVLFHAWWAIDPAVDLNNFITQQLFFYKNIGVAGGLLMVVGSGPGPLSLQRQS